MHPLNYVIGGERRQGWGWGWEEMSAAEPESDGIIGYINLAKAKYLYRWGDCNGVVAGNARAPEQQNP